MVVSTARDVSLTDQNRQALENYENGVLTKPKEVSPWWLRYSLVLFEEQQVGGWIDSGCCARLGSACEMNEGSRISMGCVELMNIFTLPPHS